MAETTGIAWTDATFNPWIGCSRVHIGCTNCYAEDYANRYGKAKWGPSGTRAKTSAGNWKGPEKWNREAEKAGVRKRVFCSSLADVFEDWTGPILDHNGKQLWHTGGPGYEAAEASYYNPVTREDLRRDLFAIIIDRTPWLDWQLLTKRPENIPRMWPEILLPAIGPPVFFRKNVWLGTSISNQETANVFAPRLLECRDLAPVLFLSMEPLLGRIDLKNIRPASSMYRYDVLRGEAYGTITRDVKPWQPKVDWCIPGVESNGKKVGRLGEFTSEEDWVGGCAEIVADCRAAGVASFVKQVPCNGVVSHESKLWGVSICSQEFPQPEGVSA